MLFRPSVDHFFQKGFFSTFSLSRGSDVSAFGSLITALTVVRSIGAKRDAFERAPNVKQRQIAFAFFAAESLDYIGSSTAVQQMSANHKKCFFTAKTTKFMDKVCGRLLPMRICFASSQMHELKILPRFETSGEVATTRHRSISSQMRVCCRPGSKPSSTRVLSRTT